MSKIIDVVVNGVTATPIKPDPHGGTTLGWAYPGLELQVLVDDPESPHDGFVTVVGPKPDPVRDDGTWKDTSRVGWIKQTRLTPVDPDVYEYRLIVEKDGDATLLRIK